MPMKHTRVDLYVTSRDYRRLDRFARAAAISAEQLATELVHEALGALEADNPNMSEIEPEGEFTIALPRATLAP